MPCAVYSHTYMHVHAHERRSCCLKITRTQVGRGVKIRAQASAKSKRRLKQKSNHSAGEGGMRGKRTRPACPCRHSPLSLLEPSFHHHPLILDTHIQEFCFPHLLSSSLFLLFNMVIHHLVRCCLSFLFALPIPLTRSSFANL